MLHNELFHVQFTTFPLFLTSGREKHFELTCSAVVMSDKIVLST